MSCASAVYACNTNTQTVVSGTTATINFGSVVRRFGRNTDISGGNVVIDGTGYYDVDTNITLAATAGSVTITLFKDGVAIPGATASFSTAGSTANTYAVSIPCIVRSTCCCDSNITAEITATGTAVSITNAAIEVSKI